jgi:hypothetical protein
VKAPLRFACKLILFREIQWIPIVGGPIRVKLPLGEAEEQEENNSEELESDSEELLQLKDETSSVEYSSDSDSGKIEQIMPYKIPRPNMVSAFRPPANRPQTLVSLHSQNQYIYIFTDYV